MAKSLEGFVLVSSVNLYVATSLLRVTPEMIAQAKRMGLEEIDYRFFRDLSSDEEYTQLEPREAELFLGLLGSRMLTQEEHTEVVDWAKKEKGPLYRSIVTQGPEIVYAPKSSEKLSAPKKVLALDSPERFRYANIYPDENKELSLEYVKRFNFIVDSGVRVTKLNLD